MAVRVNATQNGILGSRTQLELTSMSSSDWTLQGHWFRTTLRSVGCMHGSDVSSSMELVVLESFTPARKDSKCTPKWGRAIFRCNFSLAFQRAKERSNPSSYAKVMAVRVNATQNGILGPRTQLELTSSTPIRRAFRILPCRSETFENDEFH